ncbi:trem-like transcript 4 protein [Alexandromys fortis]|uniref:trem-like transcript 4 protein n=1 Tax=Alexandromys fortis TaxID=100897 RepID=UPI002152D94E|nr:trem-like transcript 4 protein [Microtus fortis]
MAWEATYLLSPILLVLLDSGCCAHAELFQVVEGQNFSVNCQYYHSQHVKEKVWCQKTSIERCKVLVSSLSPEAQRPNFSIRDHPDSLFFTVTMTTRTVRDSGHYVCGIYDNRGTVHVLKTISLVVSRAPSTTPWMTTVLASATSPVIYSPLDNWMWKGTMAGVAAFPPTAEPGSFFAITGHMSRREYRELLCCLEDCHSPADDVYCTIYATPPAKILGQKMPSVLSLRLHIDSDCLPL